MNLSKVKEGHVKEKEKVVLKHQLKHQLEVQARSTPINDRESIKTEQLNKIIEKHREEQRKRRRKRRREKAVRIK